MENERLNKWAELLLDTGKGNNLINFKDTKSTTVELLFPDFATILDRSEKSVRFEVYDPKLSNDKEDLILPPEVGTEPPAEGEEPNEEGADEGDGEAELGANDVPVITEDPTEPAEEPAEDDGADETGTVARKAPSEKEQYLKKYLSKLKKNNICLVYNADGTPITALKNIKKRADSAMEETGVNLAYVAFGFINWTEEQDKDRILHAPILLAPVTIERESTVSPFYLNIAADISINPTFLYKMQTEHGITIPEYDEEAPVEEYYEKITKLVEKLGWSVTIECKIGLFAFQKINMYKDLKENASIIIENPAIRALLNLPALEEEAPIEDPGELHNVVDADSSQNQAVKMAACGKSFVLQGPPGTGKSQSITNIIAECLARGKKVLFVSEKRAALNVVYENLRRVGLSDFCLAMHSARANKKDVIDELCRTMALPKSVVSARAQAEIDAREHAKEQLDAYSAELHAVRPTVDMSIYDLYEEYAAQRSAPALDFVIKGIEEKGADYLREAVTLLERYTGYIDSIGYDYRNNIWYGFADPNGSYENKVATRDDLKHMTVCVERLQGAADRLQQEYGALMRNLHESHIFHTFFSLMAKTDLLTTSLFKKDVLEKAIVTVKKMQALAAEVLEKKAFLAAEYTDEIFKKPGVKYHSALSTKYQGFLSHLFSGEYKAIIADLRSCRLDGKKPDYRSACTATATLAGYLDALEDFEALETKVDGLFGVGYDGVNTDFALLLQSMETLLSVLKSGVELGTLKAPAADADLSGVFYDYAMELDAAFKDSHEESLFARFDKEQYDLDTAAFTMMVPKLRNCRDNTEELDNWLEFMKLIGQFRERDLLDFLDHALDNEVDASLLISAYRRAYAAQWIDLLLRNSPILSSLTRIPHDQVVADFRKKDLLTFEINKAVIKSNLSSERPSLDLVTQGSAVAILRREGEKKRRQKSIRPLLAEIRELAQTLKPCFLMSPLSVSTYLGADFNFDVVIFDEASQIFPQDAVCAIYRGKQLIVVGDSKQMPPSNFFTSTILPDEVEQEEDEDITDFESILDLCATAFPQLRLKWHYRSRFEPLISFSNKFFYDNDLVTFPSSIPDAPGVGVDYIHVDGVFDRTTRTNRAEAEKMVELVFEHIEKYPERSLGVVAFSISQQNLIDRLITKRRQDDPSKEEFFKSDKNEPFFVKNLETVQGDERDTILFSVAYGKGSDGKLLLNFGPINKAGGERRLNVAVTRAKCNIVILSSMHGYDIDPTRTGSRGARLLGAYLDYAEKGPSVLGLGLKKEDGHNNVSDEVREFLIENGYEVETKVGFSTFKIDLAVKAPNTGRFILAIEFDGPGYHAISAARDRDRLRQGVLERMGWNFYRLWSTDWVKNNKTEKERLLDALKNALETAGASLPVPEVDPQTESFAEEAKEEHFEFPTYPLVSEFQAMKKCRGDVCNVVKMIVDEESPVHEEWLLKRICFMFGKDKVTSAVRSEYLMKMSYPERFGLERKGEFLYAKGKEVPLLRVPAPEAAQVRDIKYIALEELAKGIRAVVMKNVSVDKLGLYRLLAQMLGYGRLSENVTKRLDEALALIAKDVDIEGDTISRRDN